MSYLYNQKILFKHCDTAGIVFYPRYIEMISDLTEYFFADEIQYSFPKMFEDSAMPTIKLSAEYKKPSRLGDDLLFELSVKHIGNTSLSMQIQAGVGDEVRFLAELLVVHVNSALKPTPWPDYVRSNLEKHLINIQDG